MTPEKKSLEERMKDKGVKPEDLSPFQEPKPEGKKGLEKLYNAKSKGYPQFKYDVDKKPIDCNKGLEEYELMKKAGFRPLKSGLGEVYDAKSKDYPKLEYDTNKKTERKNEKPEIINISGQPLKIDFDIRGMKKLIFLPDYSPSRGKLPVGTVAVFDKEKHIPSAEYLGPDIGCGMLLAKFTKPIKDLEYSVYNIHEELSMSNTELGSLGSGNHFINIYEVLDSEVPELRRGDYTVLIHSGSRLKGKEVFDKRLTGEDYIHQHKLAVDFGKRNRRKLLEIVEDCANNKTEKILEKVHNSLEIENNNIIYRKGAMKLENNEVGVIPSSMIGEAILISQKENLHDLEDSICHGTGRKISRSEAKKMNFYSLDTRKKIYIPNTIYDDEIKTENPECYRTLDEIIPLINKYIKIKAKLKPLAFVN